MMLSQRQAISMHTCARVERVKRKQFTLICLEWKIPTAWKWTLQHALCLAKSPRGARVSSLLWLFTAHLCLRTVVVHLELCYSLRGSLLPTLSTIRRALCSCSRTQMKYQACQCLLKMPRYEFTMISFRYLRGVPTRMC